MSKVCEICGKGAMAVHTVSNSNKKANRRAFPNLRISKGRKICAKCLKAGKPH
ncbi:MAG: bL28 family ribosomal protein [Candidatus Firestonebacteria bacterium]